MSELQSIGDTYNQNYQKAQDRELALQLEAIRAAASIFNAWIMTESPTKDTPDCVKSASVMLKKIFNRYK